MVEAENDIKKAQERAREAIRELAGMAGYNPRKIKFYSEDFPDKGLEAGSEIIGFPGEAALYPVAPGKIRYFLTWLSDVLPACETIGGGGTASALNDTEPLLKVLLREIDPQKVEALLAAEKLVHEDTYSTSARPKHIDRMAVQMRYFSGAEGDVSEMTCTPYLVIFTTTKNQDTARHLYATLLGLGYENGEVQARNEVEAHIADKCERTKGSSKKYLFYVALEPDILQRVAQNYGTLITHAEAAKVSSAKSAEAERGQLYVEAGAKLLELYRAMGIVSETDAAAKININPPPYAAYELQISVTASQAGEIKSRVDAILDGLDPNLKVYMGTSLTSVSIEGGAKMGGLLPTLLSLSFLRRKSLKGEEASSYLLTVMPAGIEMKHGEKMDAARALMPDKLISLLEAAIREVRSGQRDAKSGGDLRR